MSPKNDFLSFTETINSANIMRYQSDKINQMSAISVESST